MSTTIHITQREADIIKSRKTAWFEMTIEGQKFFKDCPDSFDYYIVPDDDPRLLEPSDKPLKRLGIL